VIEVALPIVQPERSPVVASAGPLEPLAQALARRVAADSRPHVPQVHFVGGPAHQLFVVNGSCSFDLPAETAAEFEAAIHADNQPAVERLLAQLGLDAPPAIDDRPLASPSTRALSLAVAQKCNLGCTYCYAQQGAFGGTVKNMSLETARRAVDLLLDGCSAGGTSGQPRRLAPGNSIRGDNIRPAWHHSPMLSDDQRHAAHCRGCRVL
jgi:uncharacterized protein